MDDIQFMINIKSSNDIRNIFYSYFVTVNELFSLIFSRAKEKEEVFTDYIMPTLFLMRHSIEIALKIIIFRIDPKIYHSEKKNWGNGHDIVSIFISLNNLKPELLLNSPAIKKISNHEVILKDPEGTLFKYAYGKGGKKLLAEDLLINVSEIKDLYETFLDEYDKLLLENFADLLDEINKVKVL